MLQTAPQKLLIRFRFKGNGPERAVKESDLSPRESKCHILRLGQLNAGTVPTRVPLEPVNYEAFNCSNYGR